MKRRIEMVDQNLIEAMTKSNANNHVIGKYFAEELSRHSLEKQLTTLAGVCRKQQPNIKSGSLTGEDKEWLQSVLAEIESTERAVKAVLAADKGMASEAESLKLRHEAQQRRTGERLRDLRRGSH